MSQFQMLKSHLTRVCLFRMIFQGCDFLQVTLQNINVLSTNYSLASQKLAPGTEYTARVRSGPDQVNFGGEWSAWSSEVHWRTEWKEKGESAHHGDAQLAAQLASKYLPSQIPPPPLPPTRSDLYVRTGQGVYSCLYLGTFCALVFRLLQNVRTKISRANHRPAPLDSPLTGYGLSVLPHTDRWRKTAFIPTPAPYFHTLYSDCQGDFKVCFARGLFICARKKNYSHTQTLVHYYQIFVLLKASINI